MVFSEWASILAAIFVALLTTRGCINASDQSESNDQLSKGLIALAETTVVTLTNGWFAYGGSYGSPSVTIKDGICIVDGLVRSGIWNTVAHLPTNCRPIKRLIFNLNNNAKTARVDVQPNGIISWIAGGKDHGWISLSGIMFVVGSSGQSALSLTNGWSSYGGSYGSPSVTVKENACIVDGLVKSGAWGTIAHLPSNCRPNKRLIFNLNNHAKTARVDVQTNGIISWVAGGKEHGWVSLSGIVFTIGTSGQTKMSLTNGWTAYGGLYGVPSVTVKDGICVVDGLVKGSSWVSIAQLPSNCRPHKRLIFNLNNHAKTARVDVQPSGVVSWIAGGKDHGWISLSGLTFVAVVMAPNSITLTNGWSAYGGSYGSPSVTVKDGICIVDGLVRSGIWNTVAHLPTNCRPNKRLIFNLNNNAKTSRVDVQPNGIISWIAGGKDHGWISLSGILFPVGGLGQTPVFMRNGWSAYGGSYGSPSMSVRAGFCMIDGLVKSGSWGEIAKILDVCRPNKRLIFNVNNNAKPARVDIQPSGTISWVAGGKDHGWISLSGILFAVGSLGQTAFSLRNGWSGYGGSYGTPSVNVEDGMCIVDGLVKGGVWGTIAQLPANCRPNKRLIFNLNNHAKTARVDVLPSGIIQWVAGGKDHAWISLSGIAFAVNAVNGSCSSLEYTASNSTRDILCHLNTIVGFTEEKIRQMQVRKEKLVEQMLKGERQSVEFAKEKVEKESRAADLTKAIAELRVRVNKASAQKNALQGRVNSAFKAVATKSTEIRATQTRLSSLQVSAANAKRALDAANNRIAGEKAKRNCYFKIGKRKKRRKRRRAWRVRIRIRGRKIIRNIGRGLKRLVRKLTPCIIDNLLSRLKRDKEKYESRRNHYNRALLAAQREKRIQDASLRQLTIQKNSLLSQLGSMKSSLSTLVRRLNADSASLAQNTREHTDVVNRISNLKSMLANLEVQLKAIRQKKSSVVAIITILKIDTQKKVSDIKDLEDADPDELEDILDDIAEINDEIKKSVAKLRKLLCA